MSLGAKLPAATRPAAASARPLGSLLVWGLGYLVVGVALATASAWEVYRTPLLAVVAAVGAALGIGVVLLVRALRWSNWMIPILAAVGYLLLVVPVAIPSALGTPVSVVRGVRDGVVGIVVGWKQLLTLSLPLGAYQAVLVPFFVLIVVGTTLAAFLIVRDGRGSATAAGIVVAMACFGIVFGASDTGAAAAVGDFRLPAVREVLLGVLVVVASVVWLVGRARLRRAAALRLAQATSSSVRQFAETFALRLRRWIAAVLLVAVALGAGVAIAPIAQGLVPRQALRDAVDPLLILRQQPSPLSAYRSSFTDVGLNSELFSISGATGVDRIRLATLDAYTGDAFEVGVGRGGVRFVRLPGGTPAAGPAVTIQIGEGYHGIWLPVPGGVTSAPSFTGPRAEALSGAFYLDAASGSAIDVATAGTGYGLVAGDRYTVDAGASAAPADFASEKGAQASVSADDYPQLAAWVEHQSVTRDGAGLAELISRLRDRGYLSHSLTDAAGSAAWIATLGSTGSYTFLSSPSGHSASRIEGLFADLNVQEQRAGSDANGGSLVAAVGDDEQFSVAVALIARYLGFNSRVVLGVRTVADPADPGIPFCTEVCTGADLSAWVEVGSPTGGWTAFDVTPQHDISPITITDGEKLPENPTVPDQPASDPLDPPQAQRDDSNAASTEQPPVPGWWDVVVPVLRVVGISALALLLLVLPALVLAVAKVVRRRSLREAAQPEVSMVGAWSELVAGYLDAGLGLPIRGSRAAIAEAVGRPRALELATAVDRAVFAEHPPERDASRTSWDLVDDERRDLSAGMPLHRRILAAIAPASLLRDLGASRELVLRFVPSLRKVGRP
ncbi:MAG: transglutaminase domain-containing protein [Pseudolysinimonas sp.]|uniref:transglutaminase domain-containing protein n=1 Tax=Pseudolysinimonas sp. TaxID=2680009 RepID=UPI003263D785